MKPTDDFFKLFTIVLFILSAGGPPSLAQPAEPLSRRPAKAIVETTPLKRVPPNEVQRRIADMAQHVRPQVADAILEAARQFGQSIELSSLIWFVGTDGLVLANVAVPKSPGTPPQNDPVTLFIFTSRDLSPQAPAGFYLVRVRPSGARFVAEFLSRDGRTLHQAPASVKAAQDRARTPMCTLGPRGELILYDYHDRAIDVVIEAGISNRGSGLELNSISDEPARKLMTVARQIVTTVPNGFAGGVFVGPGAPIAAKPILLWCGNELCWCEIVHSKSDTEPWTTFSCGTFSGLFYVIIT